MGRVENLQVKDQRVLVRLDLDACVSATGELVDNSVLVKARSTIELILGRGGMPILIAHSGKSLEADRPSFAGITTKVQEILGFPVTFAADPTHARAAAKARHIVLMENLLLLKGEEKGEKELAKKLAEAGDAYVMESLSACAESWSSIVHLPALLPSAPGMGLAQEKEVLDSLLAGKNHPFVLVLGGVGVGPKLKLIQRLLPSVDQILIGGGLSYTFLKSRAVPVGNSITEQEFEVPAFQTVEKSELAQKELILPVDHVAAEQFSRTAKRKSVTEIPARWMALDIGPKTVSQYERILKKAGGVLWYGPLGVTEIEPFREGSIALLKALRKIKGPRAVIGAEMTALLPAAKAVPEDFDLVAPSAAGIIEYLMRNTLPGLEALKKEAV